MASAVDDPAGDWWKLWFAENYCWDALQYKKIGGSGAANGAQTLQDYWRRHPANPHVSRSDEALKAAGELIAEGNGRLWHVVHYPPRLADGTETWKSDPAHPHWRVLAELLSARLEAANAKRPLVRKSSISSFEGRALLTGAVMDDLPVVSGEEELLHIQATQAAFLGLVTITEEKFGRRSEFNKSLFAEEVYLEDVTARDLSFADAIFLKGITLTDCTLGLAKFSGTRFCGNVWFGGVDFPTAANFTNAKFSGKANFFESDFSSAVFFDDVTFGSDVNLVGASFSGAANFRAAKFFGRALFTGASTKDQSSAVEHEIEFSTKAAGSTTHETVGKISTPTADNALKRRSFREVDFSGATFHQDADFSNRKFLAATDFSYSAFRRLALFHDSKLHQDTSFAGTTFALPDYPIGQAATAEPVVANAAIAPTPQQLNRHFEAYERAFRTLKLAMEGHRARREEARFFRKELEARRKRPSLKPTAKDPKEVTVAEKVVSKLYEVTSGFGESLTLPLVWLLALWVLFAFCYACLTGDIATWCVIGHQNCEISPAITLAAERTWLPFLGQDASIARWWSEGTADNRLLASLVGILHRICSTLLIFLVALAAKRKYQIS